MRWWSVLIVWGCTSTIALAQPQLSVSMKQKLSHKDVSVRLQTVASLGSMGAKGIPGLIFALQDRMWRVRGNASKHLVKHGHAKLPLLSAALRHKHPRVRLHMAQIIGKIGPKARRLLPVMHLAMKDREWGVRLAVIRTLASWRDASSIPTLQASLKDPYHLVRASAATGLSGLLANRPTLLVGLLARVFDKHEAVRYAVIKGLFENRTSVSQKQRRLGLTLHFMARLKDPVWRVRWAAAHGLGRLGAVAKAAVPALKRAYYDKKRKIRGTAAIALGRIGKAALSMLPVFINTLKRDDALPLIVRNMFSPIGRYQVAMKLRKRIPYLKHLFAVTRAITAYDKLAVRPLMKEIKKRKTPHPWFVFILGCIGPNAAGTQATLMRWQKRAKLPYRWVLMLALSRIAPTDPAVRRLLWRSRKDSSSLIRIAAAKALIETKDPTFLKSKAFQAHNHAKTRIHQAANNLLIVMRTRSLTPTLFFK